MNSMCMNMKMRYRLPLVRAKVQTHTRAVTTAGWTACGYLLVGEEGTNGAIDDDGGGWVQEWEWGNPSLTVTAPATRPTPCPEYALDCTMRLYYKEVEMVTYTSKKGPEHVLYLRAYHTPTVYSYSVVLNLTKC